MRLQSRNCQLHVCVHSCSVLRKKCSWAIEHDGRIIPDRGQPEQGCSEAEPFSCAGCYTAEMAANSPCRRFPFRLRVLLIPLALGIAAVVYFFVLPAIHDRQKRQETQTKLQQIGDALHRYEAQHPAGTKDQ